jgi:hypothetical protein
MTGRAFLDVSKARAWAAMCREALSAAEDNAKLSRPIAAQTMMSIAKKFCRQGPPATGQELRLRRRQLAALSSMIQTIAFANDLAKVFSPGVAREILQEVRKFCDQELPGTPEAFAALKVQQALAKSKMEDISRANSIHRIAPSAVSESS